MPGLNQVTIIGRLGRDPEIKSFSNGGRIANLSVVTSEKWKTKDGEQREESQWHNIVIQSDALVGIAEKYLSKGNEVALVGKLKTRKWQDQSGADRYATEVVVGQIGGQLVLIGGGKQGGGSAVAAGGQPSDDLDDDVPF